MDTIVEECTAAGCSISYTVIDPSMFFKDADRMFGAMVRRGTASALGDGFNRRFNPIHGADLASRSGCGSFPRCWAADEWLSALHCTAREMTPCQNFARECSCLSFCPLYPRRICAITFT